MKTFNETQMVNPWAWCQDIIAKHGITSPMLSEVTGAPRSTVRALMGGANAAPRYELLCAIIQTCIDLETGGLELLKVIEAEKASHIEEVAVSQPVTVNEQRSIGSSAADAGYPDKEWDFL